MTQEPASFGELSPAPMLGDAGLLKQSLSARDARVGNRGSKSKSDTSLYTDVVSEASAYGEKLRSEFKKDIPAPIMKRRLSRAQVKQRILAMSPEQRMAHARKWGRPFIELAAQIAGES
jgi:hypothetical protein